MTNPIHMFPRVVIDWETFQNEAPVNSLALDGYVAGPPQFNLAKQVGNLNHHEGVDRLSTRCTASQASMLLKQGLFKRWTHPVQLFANDCDQDVCMATWLLQHPDRVTGTSSEPLLNKLLFITDAYDTCAGAYPIKTDCELVESSIWIYEPYTLNRVAGTLQTMAACGMLNIIEAVHHRIDAYLLGQGEQRKADPRYEILHNSDDMPVIREIGNEARTALLNAGIEQFVSYRGESHGRHHYSLIKLTPFTPCDLEKTYAWFNRLESLNGTDVWGGSNNCGGSPRNTGSRFSPAELFEILHPT